MRASTAIRRTVSRSRAMSVSGRRGERAEAKRIRAELVAEAYRGAQAAGQLLISTRLRDKRVELRVEDNGCGIQPEHADKIFKPLFSAKAFGVGLGLPLVQRIVERHEGDIAVQSEPGVGTVVTVWLPIVKQEPAALSAVAGQ